MSKIKEEDHSNVQGYTTGKQYIRDPSGQQSPWTANADFLKPEIFLQLVLLHAFDSSRILEFSKNFQQQKFWIPFSSLIFDNAEFRIPACIISCVRQEQWELFKKNEKHYVWKA